MDWDDDKQKAMMDYLQPPGMQQGMNTAQAMGIGAPVVGGGGPPTPPTISPKEQPLAAAVKPEEEENNNPEEDKSNIVDSHPLAQLPNYIQGQEQQIDKYGPDQQKAVMDMIQQQQGSLGNRLGSGLSGLADAFSRAGGSQSDYKKSFDENELNREKMKADVLPQLQEMNAKNMGAKERLEGMTSSTPLGSSEAIAAKLVAKELFPGKTEAEYNQLAQNPAALSKFYPSQAAFLQAMEEKKATAEFRRESLVNQRMGLENAASNERTGHVEGSARVLESKGLLKRLEELLMGPDEGTKALENIVTSGGTTGAGQAAPQAQGPFGQTTVRNGITYKWSPISGKYHPRK